jgi:hypothetical protein
MTVIYLEDLLAEKNLAKAVNGLSRRVRDAHDFPPVHQIGFVVPDVERAAEALEDLGIGPFFIIAGRAAYWREKGELRDPRLKLDLSHGPILRPPQHLPVVVFSEVPRQLMNPTEMQLPPPNHPQNAGKTAGRTACSDPLRSNSLRHPKPLRTKRKHRRERMLEVQPPPIDLPDVEEQVGGGASVFADERSKLAQQSMLPNPLERRPIHQTNTRLRSRAHTF